MEYLLSGLIDMDFTLTNTDQYVLMIGDDIVLVYVDNFVTMFRTQEELIKTLVLIQK